MTNSSDAGGMRKRWHDLWMDHGGYFSRGEALFINIPIKKFDEFCASISAPPAPDRNGILEEAAMVAELRAKVFGGEPTTRNEQQIVEHIAAAIRAMKSNPTE